MTGIKLPECTPEEAREFVKNFGKRKSLRLSDVLYAIIVGVAYGTIFGCLAGTSVFWYGVAYIGIGLLLAYLTCRVFINDILMEDLRWFLLVEALSWPLLLCWLLLIVILTTGFWLKDIIVGDEGDD